MYSIIYLVIIDLSHVYFTEDPPPPFKQGALEEERYNKSINQGRGL